jgi:hypothetical protein
MRHTLILFLILAGYACAPADEEADPGAHGATEQQPIAAPATEPVRPLETTPAEAPVSEAAEVDRRRPGAEPTEQERRVRGVVAVVGNEPFTRPAIQTPDHQVELTGELEADLRRLAGAVLEVRGSRARGTLPGQEAIVVSDYEVISIDGATPHVGRLEAADGGWWLAKPEYRVRLVSVSETLRAHAGSRIWVVGPEREGSVAVRSYGVISP